MKKLNLVERMSMYIADKGYVPSATEYVRLNDGPYKLQVIKRVCGSWSRMVSMGEHHFPYFYNFTATEQVEKVLPVVPQVEEVFVEEEEEPVLTAAQALAKLGGRDIE